MALQRAGAMTDTPAQTPYVERIFGILRVVGSVGIENAGRTEELQQVLQGIPTRRVRQFIHERLNGEGVIVACHGAQPAESNVSFRFAVLDTNVPDIERDLNPVPFQLPSSMPCLAAERGVDWGKGGALQPCDWLAPRVHRGFQVHGCDRQIVVEF